MATSSCSLQGGLLSAEEVLCQLFEVLEGLAEKVWSHRGPCRGPGALLIWEPLLGSTQPGPSPSPAC